MTDKNQGRQEQFDPNSHSHDANASGVTGGSMNESDVTRQKNKSDEEALNEQVRKGSD
jgi:hypothetical protein